MLTLIKVTVGTDMELISASILPTGTFIIIDDETIMVKEQIYTDFHEYLSKYKMAVIFLLV